MDTWADLDHYTCIVPVAGGFLHGWDCMSLSQMQAHLSEVHGVEAVLEALEE
jgi:hypothetical protein